MTYREPPIQICYGEIMDIPYFYSYKIHYMMFRFQRSIVAALLLLISFTSCEKEMSTENGGSSLSLGTNSGTSVYTYNGAPNICSTPVVTGTYQVGVSLDLTNTVTVNVDVTTPGTYVISTANINGMIFSSAGTFATTGAQTITLVGSGVPLNATTSIFVPGTNGCSFTISTSNAPVVTNFLQCRIDDVPFTFNFSAFAIKSADTLSIGGLVSGTSFEVFAIDIIGSTNLPTGQYQEEGAAPGNPFVEVGYTDDAFGIWYVDINAPTPRTNPFKVTITAISATRVKGTFTGNLYDANDIAPPKVITAGSFDLPIQ